MHQWRRGRGVGRAAPDETTSPSPLEFIAMTLPAPTPPSVPSPTDAAGSASDPLPIRLAIRRSGTVVDVSWPVTAAGDCAAFLREWLLR